MQAETPQPIADAQPAYKRLHALAAAVVLAALCMLTPAALHAENRPSTTEPAVHKPTLAKKHVRRRHPAKAKAEEAAAPPAPATPPAPKPPDWPVNDKPASATVVWDSHGLEVVASNSSLGQILEDVSTAIGARLKGFDKDQRVFGTYGPGPAREVIGQLLNGTGYNVLMVGDQGQGAPREITLSRPGVAQPGVQTASNNSSEDTGDEEEPQQAPPPIRPNFSPGMPPRTPQQIQQQFQQRMEQMRERANQADQSR